MIGPQMKRYLLMIATVIGIMWWVASTAAVFADEDDWHVVAHHRDCVRLDAFNFPGGWPIRTPQDVRTMYSNDGAKFITDKVETNAAGKMKMAVQQFIWRGEQYNFVFFDSGSLCSRIVAETFKDK